MPHSILLLQADTALKTAAAAVPAPPAEQLSLIYLLKQGGLLMIPLLLCSLILVYLFVERFLAIRKARNTDPNFMQRVREQILSGNMQGAKSLCRNTNTPEARMIEKGLSRVGRPIDQIERAMDATGRQEIYKLENNVSILNSISTIAPVFGFLGTIFGMIILFFDVQHKGFDINNIAGGIYTKMVTSAVGLIIGLLSYMAYKYIDAQINKVSNRMDAAGADFIDILQEPAK